VFIGRRLRVDFTLYILLNTFLTILKLLQISSINFIASRQRYHQGTKQVLLDAPNVRAMGIKKPMS